MKQFIEWIIGLFSRKPKPEPVKPIEPTSETPLMFDGKIRKGFTIDTIDNIDEIVESIRNLKETPMVRVVFDYPEKPAYYKEAIDKLCRVAYIIGQPSDSEYSKKMTVTQYATRFNDYINNFPQIQVWEVGNEISGDWLSPFIIQQTEAAIELCNKYSKKVMTTLYWNTTTCADRNGLWTEWCNRNLTEKIRSGTYYATLSVYGFDCEGPEPTYQELDKQLDILKHLFPYSQVMIGEFGKAGSTAVMKHYVNYPRLGFGGYWHGSQDLAKVGSSIWKVFNG